MDMPKSEPFPGKTLVADGWEYRDLPRMTQEQFNQFLDVVGEENVEFLTFARYNSDSGCRVRGQLMISPYGMQKLKEHKPQN